MSGTEMLYSKYRIALHKMSELDEILDSGIEMHSYGEAGITVLKIGLKDTDVLHSTFVQSCALTLSICVMLNHYKATTKHTNFYDPGQILNQSD